MSKETKWERELAAKEHTVILLQQKNFGPNVIYFALGITEGRGAIGPLICPNTHRGKKFRGGCLLTPKEASPELFSPVRPTSFLFDSSSITIKTIAQMKNDKHENHNKLIILEGFRQNGHHHWIQRIFLRILAPVKIDFRHLFDYDIFWHSNH